MKNVMDMAEKFEIVLVSKEELQELIDISVRGALEDFGPSQAGQDKPEFYTQKQLAEKWGVSLPTIWRHEKLGHIKAKRIGRRVLYPREQIDRIRNLKTTKRQDDRLTKGSKPQAAT